KRQTFLAKWQTFLAKHTAVPRRILLLEQQVWSIQLARQSTLRPRVAATTKSDGMWEFLLSFGILMSMALAVFQVPLVSAVTMWFQKHLGVAMGFLQAAQGLSNVLFAPLMVLLLTYGDWRWAFWGPGIVGGVLLLVLIRFFSNEPAEKGLHPLGVAPG